MRAPRFRRLCAAGLVKEELGGYPAQAMAISPIRFVCGSTGAGKTTHARTLGGVFLSVDAWMTTLFWMDSPQPIEPDWSIARVDRCAGLIWRTAVDIARSGTPCVLEIGLTTRAARDRWLAAARAEAIPVGLIVLDIPAEERWRRVEARNRMAVGDGQLGFAVTRAMFDFVEAMWEPPTPDEIAAWNGGD